MNPVADHPENTTHNDDLEGFQTEDLGNPQATDEIILDERVPFRFVRRHDRLYGLLICVVILFVTLSISLPLTKEKRQASMSEPQNVTQEKNWTMIGDPISNSVVPKEEVLAISLALSDNGKIVAIGNGHSSYVRVYAWQGQNWTQMGSDLMGRHTSFGSDVSLSGDGKTLAVGGPAQSAVRVFRYNESDRSWLSLGLTINGDSSSGEQAGSSVSLSLDGNVIAVGAHLNSDEFQRSGQVRVYRLRADGKNWVQMGSDINGEAFGDQFGNAVSLSNDGLALAVGARFHDNSESNITNVGHVRVFRFNENKWITAGDGIEGNDANEEFGYSVSLSGDGNTCAIGNTNGELTVYRYSDELQSWSSVGNSIQMSRKSFAYVSLSRDGNVLAVLDRSMHDGHLHAVTIFKYNSQSDTWIQVGSPLSGAGLALSGDGSVVAVGESSVDGLEYIRILTAT
jgi:FG-GAP repeat